MKLLINKPIFIKYWGLAEKNVASPGGMNVLCSVRMNADKNAGVYLFATDTRTSIICKADGVTVIEPGEAIFPVKGVSELFKKAASDEFSLDVMDGKATVHAGKSKIRFSTFSSSDFPDFPKASSAEPLCELPIKDLLNLIEMGALAASNTEEYPQYLYSALFESGDDQLKIVSTDNRRLSYAVCTVSGSVRQSLLLPMRGVRDLTRVIGGMSHEDPVNILYDDSQVYFVSQGVEYAVRRVESRFPPYEKILPKGSSTEMIIDRAVLSAALDRLDIIVRDYNRTVVLNLNEGKDCMITAWAPEFGQAVEEISCTVKGEPIKIGVNAKFFIDGLKVIPDTNVKIDFNGPGGHIAIKRIESDDYLCLLAPVELEKEALDIQGDAF